MLDLLNHNNKGPQANKTVTAEDVLLAAQSNTVKKSVKTGTIIVPEFTLQADAQHEANQQNIINQALIGAKEGVVEALTTLVGTEITDSVLPHINGEYKSLDEYTLHELIHAIIDKADRPPATDILTQLNHIINYVFDFRKKISANMERMQELIARITSHGVNIATSQIVLTIMANIDVASREEFGREFQPALQNIRAKYKYNHKHDNASLKVILMELAKADLVHTLKDAPAPGATTKGPPKPKTMVSTDGGNNESNSEIEKEAANDEGWTVVTKGFQPKISQHTPTKTHNAFAILTADEGPETNPPPTPLEAPATKVNQVLLNK